MPSLEPATPEFLDSAPFRVVIPVSVMASVENCWSLLADQASWVRWFGGMTAVEATPWIWTEAGQTRSVTVNGIDINETAISVEREREYAFTITKWPLPTAVRAAEAVRLEDRTNRGSPRTRLTYVGAFEPTKLGRRLEGTLTKRLTETWRSALTQLGVVASEKVALRG